MSVSFDEFIRSLTDSGILSAEEVGAARESLPDDDSTDNAEELAQELIRRNKLTSYQYDVLFGATSEPLLLGEYTVLEKIGQGGMGMVFKAEDRSTRSVVALKILPPHMTDDERAVKRFDREIRTASQLSHPHIVTTLGSGLHEGTHYLIMEFVDGDTLSELVKENGSVPLLTAVDCILHTAKGLDYAHREGIIHRDIKPSNLLLDKEGTLKILDMGLARPTSPSAGGELAPTVTDLTQSGAIMGTADYMSPEQALNAKNADERSDIYSLGCTLFFLLNAKPLYAGETVMEKLIAHREEPIPALTHVRESIPKSLNTVFKRMVAKKAKERFQSMAEVVECLEGCRNKFGYTWMMRRLADRFNDRWPRLKS